jgi:hypothetical protein
LKDLNLQEESTTEGGEGWVSWVGAKEATNLCFLLMDLSVEIVNQLVPWDEARRMRRWGPGERNGILTS